MKIYVIADFSNMTYAGFCDDETYWTVFSITLLEAPDFHKMITPVEDRKAENRELLFSGITWKDLMRLEDVTGVYIEFIAMSNLTKYPQLLSKEISHVTAQ